VAPVELAEPLGPGQTIKGPGMFDDIEIVIGHIASLTALGICDKNRYAFYGRSHPGTGIVIDHGPTVFEILHE
jgi:hypothetical protein